MAFRGLPLERQLEDRRDDSEPELAASSAAGDATDRGRDPELADQIERVAQAESHPLQHRADQRGAIMTEPQPDEGSSDLRVRVGGALSGQVGEEGEALDPWSPIVGPGQQRLEILRGSEDVTGPSERSGGRQHDPHQVPSRRGCVAERV